MNAADLGGVDLPDALPALAATQDSFHEGWERRFYALWFTMITYTRASGDETFLRPGPGIRWSIEQTDPALFGAGACC